MQGGTEKLEIGAVFTVSGALPGPTSWSPTTHSSRVASRPDDSMVFVAKDPARTPTPSGPPSRT